MSSSRADAAAGSGYILASAVLIQLSAALVEPTFHVLGAVSTSGWRFSFGAVILLAVTRPPLHQWSPPQWRAAVAMGVATAFMNVSFYSAIARIPLGAAATIEFLGPLAVALLGRRSWRHALAALVAAAGVILLSHPGGGLHPTGTFFALASGLGWALYIGAAHRVGETTPGFSGLAVAMCIAAIVTLPWTLAGLGPLGQHPALIARIFLVAAMSIVAGFGAELLALRRLGPAVVSVLYAADPAVAFAVGVLTLGEHFTLWVAGGLVAVTTASVAVTVPGLAKSRQD